MNFRPSCNARDGLFFVFLHQFQLKPQVNTSLTYLGRAELISTINLLAARGEAFFFAVDYHMSHGFVLSGDQINHPEVKFTVGTFSNFLQPVDLDDEFTWVVNAGSFEEYKPKIDYVISEIRKGNSFLTNLTQQTPIYTDAGLEHLFYLAKSKYKLWVKGQFLMMSPETFITINGRTIASFPMKGTIDASLPNAEQIILNDTKEKAEHATIVDLIRNDLSIVADSVRVKRYRYIERIKTNTKDLLQVSSEISGELPEDYLQHLGDLLFELLPAGSISGAPKAKTMEIISNAEGYDRKFYTGICGWFDGQNLDTAVMIRFIEELGEGFVFKSGGGVTFMSDPRSEYEELIQKIYVPLS